MANQVSYGFINLKNVFARRITEVGVSVIAQAVAASVAEHNRQLDALMGLFVQKTKDFKLRYKTPTVARLQPVDESGRVRPIRPGGNYDISFPLQMAAAAWGQTFLAKAKMTVEEANEATLTLLSADMRWMRDHLLAGLYTNASWTFADEQHGDLTIKGLANTDGTLYQLFTGADVGAEDSHYLAQAAAIADGANPFPTIYLELTEHPDNAGQVLALIPTNLKATVEALSNFKEIADPNIRVGANSDVLVGGLNVAVPGQVFGYVDKVWCVEWRSLPDNYMIALTTEGERALAMREDPEAELNGFRKADDRNDYPFYEQQWMRRAGFGARNRVGALVQRIGNGSYAIPTNYSSPMP